MTTKYVAWDQETDEVVKPRRKPKAGEWCRATNEHGITFKQFHLVILTANQIKTNNETMWVNFELDRTTELVKIPDDPLLNETIIYRQELRDYKNSSQFPNGDRPEMQE